MKNFVRAVAITTAIAAGFLVNAVAPASAATLTIDFTGISSGTNVALGSDFLADDLRIVNGNCDALSGNPCAALNRNEVTIITRSGGGAFTLSSYWYQLLGNRAEFLVELLDGLGNVLDADAFSAPVDGNNDDGHVVNNTFGADIFGIRFTNPGNNPGNVRFDDLVVNFETAVIPVPAAGLLLLTALGAVSAIRRRKA